MGVSKNRGTPKSSILIGFSIINHPFWGTPIFGNTHLIPPKTHKNTPRLYHRSNFIISSPLLPCHITSLDCFNRLGRTARDNISSLDLAAKKKKLRFCSIGCLAFFWRITKAFLDSEMVSIFPFLALVTPQCCLGKPKTRPLLHSLTTSWVDQGLPDHSNKGKPTIHPPPR